MIEMSSNYADIIMKMSEHVSWGHCGIWGMIQTVIRAEKKHHEANRGSERLSV